MAFEWHSRMEWKSGRIVAEDFEIEYVAEQRGRPCREPAEAFFPESVSVV